MPSADLLDNLYQAASPTHWGDEAASRPDWVRTREHLSELNGTDILDVGCWTGEFLATLEPRWKRHGIEINGEAASRAADRSVDIVGRNFSDLDSLEEDAYDAVTAFDVAEHVVDPGAFLASMVRCVRPGGFVFLASGNTGARTWRLLGSRYWYCAVGEHLSFISEPWCGAAAERLGLNIVSSTRYSHWAHQPRRRGLYEAAVNVSYRFAPGLHRWLRSRGFGDVNAGSHPELADHPPMWMTAKDHLLVVFAKP